MGKLTDEQKVELVSLYESGKTNAYLSKQFNISSSSVSGLLKQRNVKLRGQHEFGVDETYFDDVNTPEKAYFFGLLLADGCNSHNPPKYRVSINLQEQDREILEKLKDALSLERELRVIPKKKTTHSNQILLRVNSKHLSEQLISLGCIPQKSLKKVFPEWVPDTLLPHFIRGYFDGNGCITTQNRAYVSSSIFFCNKLQEILLSKLGIETGVATELAKISPLFRTIVVTSKSHVIKFLDFMYKDSNGLYIKRKHDKYVEIVNSNIFSIGC